MSSLVEAPVRGGDALPSDAELVRRAVHGERRAFSLLVDRYRPRAYRVALSVLARHEDAEDATQESLATALEHLDKCGRPDFFGGWLMTIVRNRSLNMLRRESIRITEEVPSQLPCLRTASPDRAAEAAEIRRAIVDGFAHVPAIRRRVFLMHDVEGLTHAEIRYFMDHEHVSDLRVAELAEKYVVVDDNDTPHLRRTILDDIDKLNRENKVREARALEDFIRDFVVSHPQLNEFRPRDA